MALFGYRREVLGTLATLPFLLVLVARAGHAQAVYDPETYRSLADSSSGQTIAAGTRITAQNWTKYRRFIPVGLQIAFSGRYPVKIGDGPQYVIEVSPTEHFTVPQAYSDDTEKYRGKEQLVPSAAGGYTLSPLPGTLAGLPFGPDPAEPNLAYKVLYNAWLGYAPRIANAVSYNWSIDPYKNIGQTITNVTFYQLSHLSEPGLPPMLPFAQGYLGSNRSVVLAPENSKYVVGLTMQYQDPAKIADSYTFVPSQRRSLRLSTASRCKPVPGTDFLQDDMGFQFPNFKFTYLGLKRLLTRVQDPAKGHDTGSYDATASVAGWPKVGTGTWQLRDQYVLDASPLPVMGSYCYPHKIFYIDRETWVAFYNEGYDGNGKFWKFFWITYAPLLSGGRAMLISPAGQVSMQVLDFKNNHASVSIQNDVTIGEKVPAQYQDGQQLAFPAGLHQVNQ